MKAKRNYKTFDQEEAIRKAQKLVDQLRNNEKDMKSIRIDQDTIIRIKANRDNVKQIVDKIKSKRRTINIVEQIEYGHYA